MMIIRELNAHDDFDDVGRVYAESWKTAYKGLLPQEYLDKLTHDRWSAMLRAEPSASLGVFVDGHIIGTSKVCFAREPDREGWGEIVSIYLRPDYVGQGYGRALMEAAIDKLREEGCTDVLLWALCHNERAENFYYHMGFRASGRTQHETFGSKVVTLREFCVRT